MKKIIIAAFLSLLVLTLTSCGDDTVKTMKCSSTVNQSKVEDNFQYELTYEVTYKGNDVITVKTVEKIETTEEKAKDLKEVKEETEKLYTEENKHDYYSTEVKIDGNVLTSTTSVDYSKMDSDTLAKLFPTNGELIKNGKINVNDLKEMYEAIGATCEK